MFNEVYEKNYLDYRQARIARQKRNLNIGDYSDATKAIEARRNARNHPKDGAGVVKALERHAESIGQKLLCFGDDGDGRMVYGITGTSFRAWVLL